MTTLEAERGQSVDQIATESVHVSKGESSVKRVKRVTERLDFFSVWQTEN